jgi:excisionase family DNA binding protein
MGMDMSEYLTMTEACKLLGVHPSTLRRAANAGKIKAVRTPGGRRRFPRSEIERLQTPEPPKEE